MTVRGKLVVAGLVAIGCLIVGGLVPRLALAATYADACSADPNPATCERVQVLADAETDNEHRLDLVWWGVWATVGVALVGMVAPRMMSAWDWERKVDG